MNNSGEVLKSWVRALSFLGMTVLILLMTYESRFDELPTYFWYIYGVIGAPLVGERILKQLKGGISSIKITNGKNNAG